MGQNSSKKNPKCKKQLISYSNISDNCFLKEIEKYRDFKKSVKEKYKNDPIKLEQILELGVEKDIKKQIKWKEWNNEYLNNQQFKKDVENYKKQRKARLSNTQEYEQEQIKEIKKLKSLKFTKSYEHLTNQSTSLSSPWSEKKQASSSRDEKQKEMKYNNDYFQSGFSQ